MLFELKILGSNSAMPAYGRHHTAQLLKINNTHFLIDCGEGTQLQLLKYKVKFQRIDQVYISHLHGDHYLGLVGLVKTLHLLRRTRPLKIFGPRGLQEIIIVQLKYSNTVLHYPIEFEETNPEQPQTLFENDDLWVKSFPLTHKIPCTGFLFEEKPKPRRINKEKMPNDLSLANIARLKNGEDAIDQDEKVIYTNEALTLPPRKSRKYAYCSDTCYDEDIISHIDQVDLLYHEATFMEKDKDMAKQTYHSTARQAATIASKGNAQKLLLGHFSARYSELSELVTEAKTVFDNTELALEGLDFNVKC